jgi:hypothetical protein
MNKCDRLEAENAELRAKVAAVEALVADVLRSANSAYVEYGDPRFLNGQVNVAYDIRGALEAKQ